MHLFCFFFLLFKYQMIKEAFPRHDIPYRRNKNKRNPTFLFVNRIDNDTKTGSVGHPFQ